MRRAVRPSSPARPAETQVEDPTRASAASQGSRGLGRISGAGPGAAARRTGADQPGLALGEGECHMLLALESVEC